jgi:putative NADH-flavin reductase
MRILLLGATGRIGSLVRAVALGAGHDVVALVRSERGLESHQRLTVMRGSADDASALGKGLEGVDAVVAAMGPRANTTADQQALAAAMTTLVATMARSPVRRLVALSGAAVDVPGDQKPVIDRLASRIVRRAARHIVGAKQAEFEVFSASGLDWTALRPPLVTDGPARGYRLSLALQPGARVTRADVAEALIDQLEDRAFVRAAPFVLPSKSGT